MQDLTTYTLERIADLQKAINAIIDNPDADTITAHIKTLHYSLPMLVDVRFLVRECAPVMRAARDRERHDYDARKHGYSVEIEDELTAPVMAAAGDLLQLSLWGDEVKS